MIPMEQSGDKPMYCRHSPSERTELGVDRQQGSETCLGCNLPYLPGSPNSRLRMGDPLGTVPPPEVDRAPNRAGAAGGAPVHGSAPRMTYADAMALAGAPVHRSAPGTRQRVPSTQIEDPDSSRKTAWNTYYPWALALYGVLSVILLVIIVVSWMPAPEIPGVPPSEWDGPIVPGGLGILFFLMAGRQLYLRGQSKSQ